MEVKKYTVQFSHKALKELKKILDDLQEEKLIQELINIIESKVQILEEVPKLYPKIEKIDDLGMIFRKIVLKKHIILYTIDEHNKQVYISHIFYKKSNYLNKI